MSEIKVRVYEDGYGGKVMAVDDDVRVYHGSEVIAVYNEHDEASRQAVLDAIQAIPNTKATVATDGDRLWIDGTIVATWTVVGEDE